MKNITLIISFIVLSGFIFAQDDTNEPDKTSKASSIVFKSTVYDFGTLQYQEDATGEFVFKNVTKEPVRLTNVRASCGCTGTDWPREEINKRKKGTISVTYDTKRVGKFHKNVYVYVDGNPNPIQLEIKGEVLAGEDSSNKNRTITKPVKAPEKVRLNNNAKSVNPSTKSKEKTVSTSESNTETSSETNSSEVKKSSSSVKNTANTTQKVEKKSTFKTE